MICDLSVNNFSTVFCRTGSDLERKKAQLKTSAQKTLLQIGPSQSVKLYYRTYPIVQFHCHSIQWTAHNILAIVSLLRKIFQKTYPSTFFVAIIETVKNKSTHTTLQLNILAPHNYQNYIRSHDSEGNSSIVKCSLEMSSLKDKADSLSKRE